MANILHSTARYAEAHTSAPPDLLNRVERFTYATEVLPHMISGRVTGRVLSFISALLRPNAILEIGTFTGYGTLCLSEGLTPEGFIDTIDINAETAHKAQLQFKDAGLDNRIRVHVGDAKKLIANLKNTYDLIFLDADKRQYPEYYVLLMPLLNPGGILIADNVLFYGKVLEPGADKDAQSLASFNSIVQADTSTSNILLTIDDGLMLIQKKQ